MYNCTRGTQWVYKRIEKRRTHACGQQCYVFYMYWRTQYCVPVPYQRTSTQTQTPTLLVGTSSHIRPQNADMPTCLQLIHTYTGYQYCRTVGQEARLKSCAFRKTTQKLTHPITHPTPRCFRHSVQLPSCILLPSAFAIQQAGSVSRSIKTATSLQLLCI